MSCRAGNPTFRLLNGFIGWDEAEGSGLDGFGFDDAAGLRLKQAEPGAVPAAVVLAHLPPPRLARGCGHCDWYLAGGARLLRRDCCHPVWQPVWSAACDQHLLKNATAIAARGRRIAVSDADAKRVWIWNHEGEKLIASINCERLVADLECADPNAANRIARPGPLAFTPWGELLVADTAANSIWRFGLTGQSRGQLKAELPEELSVNAGNDRREEIDRLAASNDCSIWLVTRTQRGELKLWRAARDGKKFNPARIEELQKAFKPSGLTAANEEGFCLEECGDGGLPVARCFNWCGEPLPSGIKPPAAPKLEKEGELLTRTIDSGIPRCRWHRVRVDIDVPAGTSFSIAIATSEQWNQPDASIGDHQQRRQKFLDEAPHDLDWQIFDPGQKDFLINQPPGRYLYLRLRLTGDGTRTPVARSVRLDFPRATSLDFLPPVYRDNPEAEDFTERFLALFDATIADLDRAIERAPALLDAAGLPDEALPWLGGFLDVIFDPAWDADLRRKILKALPELYRRRGTVSGLGDTINLIFGVKPVISEMAAERNWGSVAHDVDDTSGLAARLGQVRLFGRSRARFRLDTSPIGGAPLRSYGNPDHDALLGEVFRFRVSVPPPLMPGARARQHLERLVASQKPAHTVATVHFGGDGFILGNTSAIGVDTVIAPLPPPVLGAGGNVRLNRMSILWHGKHGARRGIVIGETSVVGVKTILE